MYGGIIKHTLTVIEMEDPQITKVCFLRSENAGCYYITEPLLSLQALASRHGMVLVRLCDFSDSQSGKDICGSRIASMKTYIRCRDNEGLDVTTAGEVKVTLKSDSGFRVSRFAVVEIVEIKLHIKVSMIPGIKMKNDHCSKFSNLSNWKDEA